MSVCLKGLELKFNPEIRDWTCVDSGSATAAASDFAIFWSGPSQNFVPELQVVRVAKLGPIGQTGFMPRGLTSLDVHSSPSNDSFNGMQEHRTVLSHYVYANIEVAPLLYTVKLRLGSRLRLGPSTLSTSRCEQAMHGFTHPSHP